MRQAQLAVARAHEHRRSIARYGDDDERGGDFLPHNVEDVRRMVRRTLGPLLDYDRANDGLGTSVLAPQRSLAGQRR